MSEISTAESKLLALLKESNITTLKKLIIVIADANEYIGQ